MREFLAWGDFNFPFEWATYWAKHFYIWSFQSGTPNPDGLIRLPGRLLNFLVFGATDNVGAAYFYIFSSLAIAFVAFFFFARTFLQVKRTSVQVLGALFFALNPIFLGNLAKVGLVLAVAMLPLCLLAIRAAFVHKKFRFLLLWVVGINISFLHPYTFTVNLAISGAYLAWMAWQQRHWVRDTWPKFVLVGVFALGLNAYFVLPMLSTGTVSKDVISTNITPSAVDYTALVGVSNTGDLFTGFSLSKNVFVDFAFYNQTYQNVYFFGVFMFYVILFGLYLHTEKRLGLGDKRRLGIFFGGFLVLMLLAATTVAHIDTIIKLLITMPGGWAFRSPLKWQLYIPLALFGILMILLNRVRGKGRLVAIQAGLIVTFIIMNSYITLDVFYKLLVPRPPTYFASLAQLDMTNKTVLFVNNGECMDFMRRYPTITTELNQIFTSKSTQLKHVLEDNTDAVNLGSYDYVLGCFDRLQPTLTQQYHFAQIDRYAEGAMQLYANKAGRPAITATATIYAAQQPQAIGSKYQLAKDELGTGFEFIAGNQPHHATGLQDIFETLQPKDIRPGEIIATLPTAAQNRQLYIRTPDTPLYYGIADDVVTLAPTPLPNLKPLQTTTIDLPAAVRSITYADATLQQQNLVPNGSFEQGLWQRGVTDCYAYDDKPAVGMRTTPHKTSGKQALELWAQRHIACTGPDNLQVTAGQHYLLSFDYQSPDGGKYSGYYVSFDDPGNTVVMGRMQNKDGAWHTFSKELTVPKGASHIKLLLYAYPDAYGERQHLARYDNVSLQPIPPAQDRFYLLAKPTTATQTPRSISFDSNNPTRKTVRITGASQPFYLTTSESYHAKWQAELVGSAQLVQWPFAARTLLADKDHLKLNNTMNGWYVDPVQLCQHGPGCTKTADGSYDFTLVLEFAPQRWFYFGAVLSLLTLASGTTYFWYERRRGDTEPEGRWRWRK